jgi:dTDP-4-dehydrorhamnose 3,5-epimerase
MNKLKAIDTLLSDVKVILPTIFEDGRGFFSEVYNEQTFKEAGIVLNVIQDNQSLSRQKGTLRGLHYQLHPKAQGKLVRVVRGSIYDVAVDIRQSSPTFGKWVGVELSAQNKKQLFVPAGFAHGFCTLEENTEVIYKVDAPYAPELEGGIIWNDKELAIDWPVNTPILSEKDEQLPTLANAKLFD